MKKYYIWTIVALFGFTFTVSASHPQFSFDSSQLAFSSGGKKGDVVDSFDQKYQLKKSISNDNEQLEKTIQELSKKTTYLLLGNMNAKEESVENYYRRHKEYQELAAYQYFPRDKNTKTGYDEKDGRYRYAVASELAIPQLFNQFSELGVVYHSYGDIRVTLGDDVVISTVTLPNVKVKQQNKEDAMKYDLVETNLVLYYYFMEIDHEYRLCYLYGETKDRLDQYLKEVENKETKGMMAMSTSYESKLGAIYNFDQLNQMSEAEFQQIYQSNLHHIVLLSSYYNNQIKSSAHGFFIQDGIIVTTWHFLETALTDSQYITVSGSDGTVYHIDGIITANPETDVVVIKLKEKSGTYVSLGNSSKLSVENPAITISSKLGTGYMVQKGIVIANDNYIQSSIPLTTMDEGSPLFDKNGMVIGMNTSKSTNASISISIPSNILLEIQNKFQNVDVASIKTISFEKLKEAHYYEKNNKENVVNQVPNKKWKTYSKIGDIEKNIHLKLVKASYKDGIVSLRYQNNISEYIESMKLSVAFRNQLLSDGYQETLNTSKKCIYENEDYQVIIMEEFDYLIVVMVKL